MSGVKGRSGRKKVLSTVMSEAMDSKREKLGEYLDKLEKLALDGDREALTYLVDQIIGKPKASTEIDLKGGLQLSALQQVELFQILTEKRRELDNPKLIGEGDAEGTSQDRLSA